MFKYPQLFDFYFCHITSNIKYIKKDIKCETVSHFLKYSMVWAAFGHKDDQSLTNFSTDGDVSVSQRLAGFKIARKVSNIGVLVDVIISLEIKMAGCYLLLNVSNLNAPKEQNISMATAYIRPCSSWFTDSLTLKSWNPFTGKKFVTWNDEFN